MEPTSSNFLMPFQVLNWQARFGLSRKGANVYPAYRAEVTHLELCIFSLRCDQKKLRFVAWEHRGTVMLRDIRSTYQG